MKNFIFPKIGKTMNNSESNGFECPRMDSSIAVNRPGVHVLHAGVQRATLHKAAVQLDDVRRMTLHNTP